MAVLDAIPVVRPLAAAIMTTGWVGLVVGTGWAMRNGTMDGRPPTVLARQWGGRAIVLGIGIAGVAGALSAESAGLTAPNDALWSLGMATGFAAAAFVVVAWLTTPMNSRRWRASTPSGHPFRPASPWVALAAIAYFLAAAGSSMLLGRWAFLGRRTFDPEGRSDVIMVLGIPVIIGAMVYAIRTARYIRHPPPFVPARVAPDMPPPSPPSPWPSPTGPPMPPMSSAWPPPNGPPQPGPPLKGGP